MGSRWEMEAQKGRELDEVTNLSVRVPNFFALLGQGLLCPSDGEMGGPDLGPEPP